jgi:DNA-binding transcriptional regulator YiaG
MKGKEPLKFTHTGSAERAPYHYTACGLSQVYLYGGYEVEEFDGESYVSFHNVDELHRAIMLAIVTRKADLTGEEVRFLRKEMDLTQAELAMLVGVTAQTIARLEKGETEMSGPISMLLRLFVLGHNSGKIDVEAFVRDISARDAERNQAVGLDYDPDHGWALRQAA